MIETIGRPVDDLPLVDREAHSAGEAIEGAARCRALATQQLATSPTRGSSYARLLGRFRRLGGVGTVGVTPNRQDEGMKTTYDERKFRELLVYVASRLQGDRSGGATKLNKVIFFADFAHVRRTGAPITGAEYQKLEHGPAARRLRPVRDLLIENGIDKVLEDLDGLNARQVSDLSHDEAGWRLVDIGETIPYEAALVGARQVSTPTPRARGHRRNRATCHVIRRVEVSHAVHQKASERRRQASGMASSGPRRVKARSMTLSADRSPPQSLRFETSTRRRKTSFQPCAPTPWWTRSAAR
jgi:hypothetical protein